MTSMKINIGSRTGRSIPLEVSGTETILDVKHKIQDKDGIAPEQQQLTYMGRELQDNKTIAECGIQNDATIQIAIRLRGR